MRYFHTATQKRSEKVGNKYLYNTLGSFSCNLQPLGSEDTLLTGMTYSQSSKCYVPITSDVLEGDRLTINGSTFGVRGIQVLNFGKLAHKKLLLEKLSV